jgi:hypothetical protein
LGLFSEDFSAVFGEQPSAVLNRQKRHRSINFPIGLVAKLPTGLRNRDQTSSVAELLLR